MAMASGEAAMSVPARRGKGWLTIRDAAFYASCGVGTMRKLVAEGCVVMYTLREASRVTGVPYDTLRIECKAGRLRSQLPEGRKVGRMVRPEWVEQWIEEGTHGIEAA